MRKHFLSSFSLGAIALAVAMPANAVVLEHKWQPGQQLTYDLTLDGSLDVQTASDVPVLWAGVPLEVQVHGKGESRMETLKVDDSGTGTVAVKIPKLSLQGEALGQKGELRINAGKTQFLLNGKALAMGNPADGQSDPAKILSEPPVALRITRNGKLAGIEKLPAPAAQKAAPQADEAPVTLENAIDKAALAQAMILRALPSLWPGKDVQPGEKWDAIVPWPQADGTFAAKPLGQFELTLKDKETVNGRELYRVTVDGALTLDEDKLAQINKGAARATAGKPAAATNTITGAGQRVKGDLWFDAAAGQIAKAELLLNSHTATRSQKPGAKPGGESWADFNGTLQMQLKPAA